tara:strand:- start:2541 stop:3485 length:945 start_codon:yes stop_codon:yes gene_type:complete
MATAAISVSENKSDSVKVRDCFGVCARGARKLNTVEIRAGNNADDDSGRQVTIQRPSSGNLSLFGAISGRSARVKKIIKGIALCLGLLALGLGWLGWQLYGEIQKSRSDDPLVWEQDIQALESSTRGSNDSGRGVVFVGSSSIRLWDSLPEDMAPIEVIQHGFGGAKLHDIVYYAERLVNAYQPRAVVVFAGTNDIDPSAVKPPEQLLASYQAFVASVRADQPDVPIYYIGITPSPMRWSVWPVAQTVNALIQEWSEYDPNLHFIDTSASLLGSDGEPDPDNYRFDGLHLSAQGYAVWREIIRKHLLDEIGAAN